MQFSARTDYAIRVLLFLSDRRGMVPMHVIAEALGISEHYLPKTLRIMRKERWITSVGGSTGGHQLVVPVESLTLWDVMCVMEDSMQCNRCLEPDKYCSRNATAYCPMRKVYKAYQQMNEAFWKSITIADVKRSGGVAQILRAFPYTFSSEVMREAQGEAEDLRTLALEG